MGIEMYALSIEIGIRQIKRWIIAAKQDAHPGIKMLHANYAVGNIDMLRQQFTDEEILRTTGEYIRELHGAAVALQDEAFEEATFMCPHLRPAIPF